MVTLFAKNIAILLENIPIFLAKLTHLSCVIAYIYICILHLYNQCLVCTDFKAKKIRTVTKNRKVPESDKII